MNNKQKISRKLAIVQPMKFLKTLPSKRSLKIKNNEFCKQRDFITKSG